MGVDALGVLLIAMRLVPAGVLLVIFTAECGRKKSSRACVAAHRHSLQELAPWLM
jgi:hypothetical protein